MILESAAVGPFFKNGYVVGCENTRQAVFIDPGDEVEELLAFIRAEKLEVTHILLTHAHVDHASEAGDLAGDDVPVFVHPADAVAFEDLARWDPGFDNPLAPVKDLRTVEDGEVLMLAGLSFAVHHTPGHTPGHCSFEVETSLAGGDLVFAGSIGRSDFPNSSPADMERSLRWFLALDDQVRVLPGHGPATTVGAERASNPFLAGLR